MRSTGAVSVTAMCRVHMNMQQDEKIWDILFLPDRVFGGL